jgi:hypothetical protein
MRFLRAQYGKGWDQAMNFSSSWLRKVMACCLVMYLTVPFTEASPAPPQQAIAGPQLPGVPAAQSQPQYSDHHTGKLDIVISHSDVDYPDAPDPVGLLSDVQSGQSNALPPVWAQSQQDSAPKPVGTAAAPYEKTTGVAASRPAGAVIAPAKQHRARSILIRVGIVVGTAAAIGTVALLSSASPSRPN